MVAVILQILALFVLGILMAFTGWIEYRKRRGARLLGKDCIHDTGYPLIGILPRVYRIRNVKDCYDFIMSMVKENKIVSTWVAHKNYITLHDPFVVEKVMSCPDAVEKTDEYKTMGILADGVFIAGKKRWKKMRKALNKTFTPDKIDSYFDTAVDLSKICNKVVEREALNQGYVDVLPYTARYLIDLLLKTHYGLPDVNEQEENKYDLMDHMVFLLDVAFGQRILKPYYHYDFIFQFSNLYKRGLETAKKFYRPIEDSVKIGYPEWKLRKENNGGEPINLNLMDHYYQLMEYFNIKPEQDNINKFTSDVLIGGTDTPAYGISSLMYFLALHQDIQERVYKEIMEHFPKTGDITKESLDKMTYFDMCLYETLRIVCPPGVLRTISQDLPISKDCVLPKGSNLYVVIQLLHTNPKHWARPKSFYPEHFLPEAVAARPKMAYLPFSGGPRSCPGIQYGMQAMKVLVCYLLKEFHFETNLPYEKIEIQIHFMREFIQGYPIKFSRRNNVTTF